MAPRKKHTSDILAMRNKGMTGKEIASKLGIAESTVWYNLSISEDENKKISQFNKDLPNHLSKAIAKITHQLLNTDLSKLSGYQLVGMASMLIDKQRLITGQSTSNSAVLFNIVSQACTPERPGPTKNEGGG